MDWEKIGNIIVDNTTLRGYLMSLLITLWRKGEGFSSKRPLGDSDWQTKIVVALIEAGYEVGKAEKSDYGDYYDYIEEDWSEVNKIINGLITHIFNGGV